LISDFRIPKGTSVVCNLWALHHDDKIWNNPFEFQPDRFLIRTRLQHGEGASNAKVERKRESPADEIQTQDPPKSHINRPDNIKPENIKASGNNSRKPPMNTLASAYRLVPSDHPLRSSLLPFGAGPRGCSGEMIALMQMFTMLVMLMQKVDILPADDRDNQPSFNPCQMRLGAVLKPAPFKARFVARYSTTD
jgi:cytochrome P450